MRRINLGIVFGIVLIPVLTSVSSGQADASQRESRIPVTIIFSDQLSSDSRFLVQRNPKSAPRDRIVLRSDATGDDLMSAINTLLTARQIDGDVPSAERTFRIRPTGESRAQRAPYPWVARVLSEVRQAAPKDVPGIGRARAVQIWLPARYGPERRHAKTRQ